MKSFLDNAGRTWTLAVNVAAIKRVRALCDVDLTKIVELDAQGRPSAELLERLANDPVLLVDVLYAVCKPEADANGVTDEAFGGAMVGDAIEHATSALLDEVVDFFPEAKRLALRKILAAGRRFAAIATERMKTLLGDEKFEENLVSELVRSSGLSTNAPESAE